MSSTHEVTLLLASWAKGNQEALNELMPLVSHPFVERLIGTVRRECLDRTLFWTTTDLEAKLLDFQHYYNEHRTHAGRAEARSGHLNTNA